MRRALLLPGVQLFLTSAIVLFAELLLIRWIPANVTYIGFFSNLIVMASFLGIGVGILVGRRHQLRGFAVHGPLLAVLVVLVQVARIDVRPAVEGSFLGGLAHAADPNLVVIPLVFTLVAAVLTALALPLGPLLRALPPLRAYAIEIGGSLSGIVVFTAVSAAGAPPPVWFAILALALAARNAFRPGRAALIGSASFTVILTLATLAQYVTGDVWSPYYRISMLYPPNAQAVLAVNGIPHQNFYALNSPKREAFYDQIYRWLPDRRFDRVLVIGAGNGTDVAGALAHGAKSVDAVEIDPRILELGERLAPDRPYADPRVREIVDDGRAELRRSTRTYDLIVFALTDSLTLASSSGNLRLESFLYTEESFASARDHLAPDGVVVVYNYYYRPFLVAKLSRMLQDVFGTPTVVRSYGGNETNFGAAFAAGPGIHPAGALGDRVDPAVDVAAAGPIATDDWPFLYLETRRIDSLYLGVLAAILAISLAGTIVAARIAGTRLTRISPHFFALGAAFLLLETKNLATFGLLFGTTWMVNALVFAAILLSVLAAIAVTSRVRIRGWLPYVLLGLSLLAVFAVPPERLLFDPPVLRYAVASVLAFLPVFFANLVFTASFRDTRGADMAFASNVLGAVVGGCLEYLALIVGYRDLGLLIAGLYALALVFARLRLFGDRDIVSWEAAIR